MHKYLILIVSLMIATIVGCSSDKSKTKLMPYDFSYEAYSRLLTPNVDNGLVDYISIKANRSLLDSLVNRIETADLTETTENQKLAFYINAYNIITIRSVVDAYPVASIKEIDGVWDVRKWVVAGEQHTLNEIEHEILRKQFAEPRIHVAIVCASIGCPPLLEVPYYPNQLDSLLAVASQRFAQSDSYNVIDPASGKVKLSAIFDWFGDDFIAQYYDANRFPSLDQKTSAALTFVLDNMAVENKVQMDKVIVPIEYLEYDWSLNELKH